MLVAICIFKKLCLQCQSKIYNAKFMYAQPLNNIRRSVCCSLWDHTLHRKRNWSHRRPRQPMVFKQVQYYINRYQLYSRRQEILELPDNFSISRRRWNSTSTMDPTGVSAEGANQWKSLLPPCNRVHTHIYPSGGIPLWPWCKTKSYICVRISKFRPHINLRHLS